MIKALIRLITLRNVAFLALAYILIMLVISISLPRDPNRLGSNLSFSRCDPFIYDEQLDALSRSISKYRPDRDIYFSGAKLRRHNGSCEFIELMALSKSDRTYSCAERVDSVSSLFDLSIESAREIGVEGVESMSYSSVIGIAFGFQKNSTCFIRIRDNHMLKP
jgi:hypothetical protein